MRGVEAKQEEGIIERSNIRSNMEVAKPPGFDREVGRVREFIMACRLYLRMRMRRAIVEE